MRSWRRPGPVWLVLAISVGPAPALAQGTRAGIVTTLEGDVTAVRAVAPAPVALKFRDDVFVRDRVVTGEQSFARLLLGGKAVISIRERSAVTITEVPGRSTVEIESGKIALSVARDRMRPGEIINIKTPNAIAGVRGTVVIAEVNQSLSTMWVLRGAVEAVHTSLAGVPLSAPVPLAPREFFSADPTAARKGSFTMEQVPTILQGLQPQGGQDPGTASQGPARLAAVDVALADLGAMTGQRLTSLLGPSPSITVPDMNPGQTVTEAPITPLTSVPLLVSPTRVVVGPPPPVGQPPVVGPPPPVPPRPPDNRPPSDCEYPRRGPHKPPRRY
jgi:FecR protein